MPSDDYILVIAGFILTKRACMVRRMKLMHMTSLNAESEPKVSDAE